MWRSSSGDSGSWTSVVTGGFGNPGITYITSLTEFGGYLYAGTDNKLGTGGEVWRSSTGDSGSWERVVASGFGDVNNRSIITLEPFGSYLYASTYNQEEGCEVWRSTTGNSGTWALVVSGGFNDFENRGVYSLFGYNERLFAFTENPTTGIEVWNTEEGINWTQVGPDGLGDSNNNLVYYKNAVTLFNDILHVGIRNGANGGEVWKYEPEYEIYLPLILRNFQQSTTSTWNQFSSPTTETLNAVDMVSSTDGWAVGDGGTIILWNGSNWSTISSPTSNKMNSVEMISSNDGWAVGDGGTIIHWDGNNWSTTSSPTSNKLNSVDMISSTDGWAVGDGGTIIHWDGNNWSTYSSPTNYDLKGVSFTSSDNGWAVGGSWNSVIGWYEDAKVQWNGSTWILYTHFRILDVFYGVDFTSASYGWTVGHNNAKASWDGMFWDQNYGNQPMMVHYDLDMLSTDNGWAVGWDYSRSNIRHWDGSEWAEETCPVSETLYGLSMVSENEGWAVGENGTILRYGP